MMSELYTFKVPPDLDTNRTADSYRESSTGIPAYKTQETAEQIKVDVARDFRGSMAHHAEAEELLTEVLPVSDDVLDDVLKDMEKMGIYSALGKRWEDFPLANAKAKEDVVYKAFHKVSNIVLAAAEKSIKRRLGREFPESEYLGASEWVDHHAKVPGSQDDTTASIRPDAVLVLKPSSSKVRWSEIVTVVEMKRTDTENLKDRESVIKQLVGYLRLILREQIDRRFVIGFTLGPSKLNVVLHDRSGVLASDTSIDIHEDPKAFIRIIAASVALPAHKLGFDPSMKLYNQSTKVATPRYRLSGATYSDNHQDMQWVISMNNGEEYLTVKTLSTTRLGFKHGGRATVAWVVVPYGPRLHDDSEASEDEEPQTPPGSSPKSDEASGIDEEPQVFVLKQSWKPVDIESEGYFYQVAEASKCDKIAAIALYEETTINGEKDETVKLIRQNLTSKPFPKSRPGIKRPRPEDEDSQMHTKTTDGESQALDGEEPVNRVHTKVLLNPQGWSEKHFISPGELTRSMRDSIEGHQYLYMNGVLHRDISTGNIIIVQRKPAAGTTDATSSYGGCLIDLDRAKAGHLNVPALEIPNAERRRRALNLPDILVEQLAVSVTDSVAVANLTISPDVVRYANSLQFDMPESMVYLRHAVAHSIAFHGLPKSGVCSLESLHWNKIVKHYNFHNDSRNSPEQKSKTPTRTGTPPFSSYEILSGQPYYPGNSPQHEAVHDIESFFWVLVHLCLTRQASGGKRPSADYNEELPKNPDGSVAYTLDKVVFCAFDSEDQTLLATTKQQLFHTPMIFEHCILANFHPSFTPFKPLVREWYSLLRLAHQFHGYEYHDIHDRTLEIFNSFLKSQGPELEHVEGEGKTLLDAREADIQRFRSLGVSVIDAGTVQNGWDDSPRRTFNQTRSTTGISTSPSHRIIKRLRTDVQKEMGHLDRQ